MSKYETECLVYDVNSIRNMLGISKSAAYSFLKNAAENNSFIIHHVGRNYLVEKTSFEKWLYNKPSNPSVSN